MQTYSFAALEFGYIQNSIMTESKTSHNSKRNKHVWTREKALLTKIKEKQNHFLLDCTNEQKSRLKKYDSTSDKFLHYFVVRVHQKNNKHTFATNKKKHTTHKNIVSHNKLQKILNQEKEKLMMTCQSKFGENCLHEKHSILKDHRSFKNRMQQSKNDLLLRIQNSISYKKSPNSEQQSLQTTCKND